MNEKQQLANLIYDTVTELNKNIQLAKNVGLTVYISQSLSNNDVSVSVHERLEFNQNPSETPVRLSKEFIEAIKRAIRDGLFEL